MADRREAYTVRVCRSCDADSALEVEPGRYVCVACGETGRVVHGGFGNVPDSKPDAMLAARLSVIMESVLMKQFQTLCKAHRVRPRGLRSLRGGKT